MKLFNKTRRTPIGLDIGGRHVMAVQLEPPCHGGQFKVSAAAVVPRAVAGAQLDRGEVRRVADILARRGFVGNQIVVPVPEDKLISGVLECPPRTAQAPIEQIARMELARTSRCAPDSFEMGCWPLPAEPRAGRSSQVMAVGCPHRDADALIEIFVQEGLEVVALDVRASALARATRSLLPQEKPICAVLDLGWSGSMLVILYGGTVVYTRGLSDGGIRVLHQALHERLRLESDVADYLLDEIGLAGKAKDDDGIELPMEARTLLAAHIETLVQELNVSFSYITHEYPDAPLAQLLLTGSAANVPGLAEHLQAVLGIEARVVTAADVVESAPGLSEMCGSPALVVAAGLAQFREE